MYHILIVDDNPVNIALLKGLLQKTYRINTATSGKCALEIAREDPPDMILLDTAMPEMDGYEVCRRLKAHEDTSAIPILFLSALSEVADLQKGLELGAVDFIHKPISPPLALVRIKNHMDFKKLRELLVEVTEHSMKLRQRMNNFEARDKMNRFHMQSKEDTSKFLMVNLPMGRT